MYGSRGFAVSRSDDGDRNRVGCYRSNVDSSLNQVSEQQQQQQLRRRNDRNQLQGMAVADTDNLTDSDDSNATLSIATLLSSTSLSCPSRTPKNVTNLDSFLYSVTPVVPAQESSESSLWGHVSREAETHPFYHLGDLWETFREWSAYGAGVPFWLFGVYPTTQYYTPYLSGMQLYVDPKKTNTRHRSSGEDDSKLLKDFHMVGQHKLKNLKHQVPLRDNKAEVCCFEYMEQDQPHVRRPLADMVSYLESAFPELRNYRSCDLSPSSWICVAWYISHPEVAKYPIYRIPIGPTLRDLEASFLTLYSLSTQPGSYGEREFSSRSGRMVHDEFNPSSGVCLPIIGLASYKLKGSIISPYDPQERAQENALLEAANNWLQNVHALLPDYQFFLNRYSH